MGFIERLIQRVIRWYTERLVCLHFCKFKQAGSDLKYTHVHILSSNPSGASGLGHDDHTNNDNDGHVTISDGDGIRIQAEDDASMGLRQGYLGTAHFHQGTESEACPRGFRKIKCRCQNAEGQAEDVWACYTMDYEAFRSWYEGQRWDNRAGEYRYPSINISGAVPESIACGKTITRRSQVSIATTLA